MHTGRYLGEAYLAFVLVAVMAQNLNVRYMIGTALATGHNVIIFQIERATASTAAVIVFDHCGLPEVFLGLGDLRHDVFLYVMGTV